MSLRRPLLLEGEAGVGKTEVAKVLAAWTGGELIRLQCYEGIDAAQAVYDWDYGRQLLHLRAAEASGESAGRSTDALEAELYQERFLVKRALLRAIEPREGPPPVLLVDEIDRADDEFEAYLLEVLSDWQITIPELGMFRADDPPLVVLTSNRTRDVHDALKRRCLYHWVEHPDFDREVAIVRLRAPEVGEPLARQVAAAVAALRELSLYKPPGVAETIDWATALGRLGVTELDERAVDGDARHGAQVPRGPRARRAARLRRHRQAGARARRALTVTSRRRPPTSAPRRWPSPSPACCAAPGSPCRRAPCSPSPRRSAPSASTDRDDVYWAGRATLVRRPEDIARVRPGVPRLLGPRRAVRPSDRGARAGADHARRRRRDDDDDGPDDGAEPSDDPTIELRFSATEVLRHKDFAAYDDAELAEAHRLMAPACGSPARRAGRCAWRRRRGARARPDLRRTVRAALRTEGEPMRRHFRDAGDAPPPARAAARRQRLDGAVRPGAAALRPGRGRRTPAGRGVRPRHPADPDHPRAGLRATPTAPCARPPGGSSTGPAAPGSATGCAGSTTSGACAAWPAARSS